MEKGFTITYEYGDNLYVNPTNRCNFNCEFCLRKNGNDGSIYTHNLWLKREPGLEEIFELLAQWDLSRYSELVFCGYGEPTERLDVLAAVARHAKERFGCRVRVNTNGMADLIWGRDTSADFAGIVDVVSISLNSPDPEKYQAVVRSRFGEKSFHAMLAFAQNVKRYVPEVVLTTVETVLTKEEEERCAEICRNIGVTYRIRPWE